jgi:AcrR family transcriptional regulator
VQRRSRERVELIMKTSSELLAEGGVDALTTRSLAERTGIPVATIYRYFDSRDEIIAAYLDHDLQQIEESVTSALMALERVTFRSMVEAVALAHMRHHQAHPEGVTVWFGGRMNAAVVEAVQILEERLAASLHSVVVGQGMTPHGPDFIAGLLVRLFERTFEFVFLTERPAAEQEQIVLTFVDIVATYIERFATPAGLEGISPQEFVRALAEGRA